jgi:hypothetical protein
MKGWDLLFEHRAKVLVLMLFSQLDDKTVNPPSAPSAATEQTTLSSPVLMMLGVFFMVFTAGFSNKLLGELKLLRSEVSLLRLAAEKIAGQ